MNGCGHAVYLFTSEVSALILLHITAQIQVTLSQSGPWLYGNAVLKAGPNSETDAQGRENAREKSVENYFALQKGDCLGSLTRELCEDGNKMLETAIGVIRRLIIQSQCEVTSAGKVVHYHIELRMLGLTVECFKNLNAFPYSSLRYSASNQLNRRKLQWRPLASSVS